MDSQRVDRVLEDIESLKTNVDKKMDQKLELDQCKGLVKRLASFSAECDDCCMYFEELEDHFEKLQSTKEAPDVDQVKHHKKKLVSIRSHLQKKHNLVTDGYYMSIYMSLGSGIGLVFGILIFDNLALGLPIGVGVGIAIGASLDAKAKKNGMTL